jgi:hypothetical protein
MNRCRRKCSTLFSSCCAAGIAALVRPQVNVQVRQDASCTSSTRRVRGAAQKAGNVLHVLDDRWCRLRLVEPLVWARLPQIKWAALMCYLWIVLLFLSSRADFRFRAAVRLVSGVDGRLGLLAVGICRSCSHCESVASRCGSAQCFGGAGLGSMSRTGEFQGWF